MTVTSPGGFVRGKYQLARYEPGSAATGRRLTEHEVLSAYGAGVVAELDAEGAAVLLASEGAIERAIATRRAALGVTADELASAAGVTAPDVARAEAEADKLPLREIERIAFVLGLDPMRLSFDEHAGADSDLGMRLRVLETDAGARIRLTHQAVLCFTEAASIIMTQLRLQHWLDKREEASAFASSSDYGPPAWGAGYDLAAQARKRLGLGERPIESMRDLVEQRLGIPVIQAQLPASIAGATLSSHGRRGIVLNTQGRNTNVWIRRATLAHELGHILFDPEPRLSPVRVDAYDDLARDAKDERLPDDVESRANAFAVEFLAPMAAVKKLVPDVADVSAAHVGAVMSTFGIGRAAARYHVGNAWWRRADLPPEQAIKAQPTDEQNAAEEFTLDYFPIKGVPDQRRGRFALLTAEAVDAGLITADTAAQHLACSEADVTGALPFLLELG